MSITVSTNQHTALSRSVWTNMISRCNPTGAEQKRSSTYIGCIVSDEFKNLSLFTDWHTKQVGYGIEGYHLDKDLLSDGIKTYSESNCVLIPKALNQFLTNSAAIRGDYPQGVTLFKGRGVYRADIRIDGKSCYLGQYTTIEQASAAYKKAKETEAHRWYERLLAKEFIVDDRVIERMRTWTLPDNN